MASVVPLNGTERLVRSKSIVNDLFGQAARGAMKRTIEAGQPVPNSKLASIRENNVRIIDISACAVK